MNRTVGVALLAGILFGVGLAISGMANPWVVQGFLDITGDFNPQLMFVLGGAVGVTLPAFRWVQRQPRPRWADSFHLPTKRRIDAPLLGGAALFGIGWGLAGFCPGPALVGAAAGVPGAVILLLSMVAGSQLYRGWQWWRAR